VIRGVLWGAFHIPRRFLVTIERTAHFVAALQPFLKRAEAVRRGISFPRHQTESFLRSAGAVLSLKTRLPTLVNGSEYPSPKGLKGRESGPIGRTMERASVSEEADGVTSRLEDFRSGTVLTPFQSKERELFRQI
jgi:hypothetical protein